MAEFDALKASNTELAQIIIHLTTAIREQEETLDALQATLGDQLHATQQLHDDIRQQAQSLAENAKQQQIAIERLCDALERQINKRTRAPELILVFILLLAAAGFFTAWKWLHGG